MNFEYIMSIAFLVLSAGLFYTSGACAYSAIYPDHGDDDEDRAEHWKFHRMSAIAGLVLFLAGLRHFV